MSKAAFAYYQESFQQAEAMPPILSGEPARLLPQGARISVQRPDPENVQHVFNNYRAAVTDVGRFVAAQAGCDERAANPMYVGQNTLQVKRIADLLEPPKLHAGHLRDVTIEAVNPDEIAPRLLERATERRDDSVLWHNRETTATLVTSAELYAGRVLGRVAMATFIAADRNRNTYRIATLFYKKNELLAQSGFWQSTAVKTYIEHWGAACPVLESVRRGKAAKGSRQQKY